MSRWSRSPILVSWVYTSCFVSFLIVLGATLFRPGINGALTTAQTLKDHSDTLESFKTDIIKSGGGRSTPELVDVLVEKSAEVPHLLFMPCVDVDKISRANRGGGGGRISWGVL